MKWTTLLLMLVAAAPALAVDPIVPEPYAVVAGDINAGGTRSVAGDYALTASTGQAGGIGMIDASTYEADDGFWYRAMDFNGVFLLLTVKHPDYGGVTVEPNQPYYEPNTLVTLTASKVEDKTWAGWAGDVPEGHELDNPLSLTMDSSKEITTAFKCGMGSAGAFPLILAVLGLFVWVRRAW